MPDEWERTGNVNFKGLGNSLTDLPKQTEMRNTQTGETRWVSGNVGDGNDELGKHIEDGDWEDEDEDEDED